MDIKKRFNSEAEFSKFYNLLIIPSGEKKKIVGDRVAYPFSNYVIGASNPAIGTSFECLGTVIEITETGVRVHWDNLHQNSYAHNDLFLVTERTNPNILFARKKAKTT
jgi:hypothetical protein